MGAYTQTNGSSMPVSTGGKGTSASQYPGYANYNQMPWLNILSGILQQRQQPAFQYQAPNYAQMQQQALPQGWPTPPPMYTPPPPPPAAAPSQDTERRMAEMQARINQLTEQQARPYDPGQMTQARGGRIKKKAKSDIVEQALAVTRRK